MTAATGSLALLLAIERTMCLTELFLAVPVEVSVLVAHPGGASRSIGWFIHLCLVPPGTGDLLGIQLGVEQDGRNQDQAGDEIFYCRFDRRPKVLNADTSTQN